MTDVKIAENEKIIWENRADQWFISSNLFVKMAALIAKLTNLVFGRRKRGTVIVTDKRLIYRSSSYFLWCIQSATNTDSIFLNQISSLSYGYEASFLCFCKSKVVRVFSTGSFNTQFVFRGISEQDLERRINDVSATIAAL